MKVALAHHWVMSYRGGERVLEQIASLYENAPLYLLTHDSKIEVPGIVGHEIRTSALNRSSLTRRFYKHLLPIHPYAIKRLTVEPGTDLLITCDASMMKGISHGPETKHVCYCFSPPRYLWELTEEYKSNSLATRLMLDRFIPALKRFDYEAAQRVDHFIADSKFVAQRIRKYYQRDSVVVYPPVANHEFSPTQKRESFYLVVSELTPYKRIDVAIDAFAGTDRRLIVIGDGSERWRLESKATANITFLGRQPFSTVKRHFETAAAFVFPGIEDFGIAPVEAQAAGCPVIAYRAGGALETVIDAVTGYFFDEQSGQSLRDSLDRLEQSPIDSDACAANAQNFSYQRFHEDFRYCIDQFMGSSSLLAQPI